MANLSAGDTVVSTNSNNLTTNGDASVIAGSGGSEFRSQCTRKRRIDPLAARTEIPEKTQRRDEQRQDDPNVFSVDSRSISSTRNGRINVDFTEESRRDVDDISRDFELYENSCDDVKSARVKSKRPSEAHDDRESREMQNERDSWQSCTKRKREEQSQAASPTTHQDVATRRAAAERNTKRDEATRLRKTIQWLEEGARRLREDLANARTELHEERRASKIARRETEAALREARAMEAIKYQSIVAELKTRLSRFTPNDAACRTPSPSAASPSSKVELMKEENHKREISALKKRLAEAEKTIRRLKWESLNYQTKTTCKAGGTSCVEVRRLDTEIRILRASNEKLEEKLRISMEAEKARAAELRIQHETQEAELCGLRKSFRSETIKMMDELRAKDRQIEKLSSKLRHGDASRKHRKSSAKDTDVAMRKLREGEKNGPIRPISRTEKKFLAGDCHAVDSYIREVGCDGAITEVEVERLRELAIEQQEVIEILRQALKERERKLEQLSNKRRKEEFYRQWLELEPVAEVDDEEDHEEGDSALSSAPSSLSPQPGGCGQWQSNGVNRDAYEAVLIEVEELQSKLLDERQELSHAKGQVRELEKALLQETRCGGRNKEFIELNDKLRATEEREAALLVELSELREQNELLEFRLLELEEMSARRDSPDHTADSGIVSPEPMHLCKDQPNKQRSRAVATVIPYTTTLTNSRPVSPIPRKPPLSLQESGIFEEDDEEDEDGDDLEVELTSRSTQTDVPEGELLQEVQRLQELRARIQERAAKVTTPTVCQIETSRSSPNLEVAGSDTVDAIVQLSSYQERIRELEDRLETYEETEEHRHREKLLSKQREEELLDENYRLTERVYWLENELRNAEETTARKAAPEVEESTSDEKENDSMAIDMNESKGDEVPVNSTMNSTMKSTEDFDDEENSREDDDRKDLNDGREAKSIVEVKREDGEDEEIEADEAGEADVADVEEKMEVQETSKTFEIYDRAKYVQTDEPLVDSSKTICCHCGGQEATRNADDLMRWTRKQHRVTIESPLNIADQGTSVEEVAKEAKESDDEEGDGAKPEEANKAEETEKNANERPKSDGNEKLADVADEMDGEKHRRTRLSGAVSQVFVMPAEEESPILVEGVQPLVTFTETESEKKVIYFRWR